MLFDAYIAVDWSARSRRGPAKPSKDSVWAGELVDGECIEPRYFRTRACCVEHVRARLIEHVSAGRRVFVGFDFAYGYPAGLADGLVRSAGVPSWRWTWDVLSAEIVDGPDNRNNRFAVASELNWRCGDHVPGPFWGCPASAETPTLTARSREFFSYPCGGPGGLDRLRRTERLLPGVQSVWKLAGIGSVGSQALTGIPAVARLRDDPELAWCSQVWPFETGFTAKPTGSAGPAIVHAEIWPGTVNDRLDASIPIRDKAQVCAYVRWLHALDRDGLLGGLFAAGPDDQDCVNEEGWILGAIASQD